MKHEPARLGSSCEAHVPTITAGLATNEARRSNTAEHIAPAELSEKMGWQNGTLGASHQSGATQGKRAGASLVFFTKPQSRLWCSDTLIVPQLFFRSETEEWELGLFAILCCLSPNYLPSASCPPT